MSASRDAFAGKTFFLGLGAQKAGSTWLADQLAGHDQFLMSPIKELHYWDRRFHPAFFARRDPRQALRRAIERFDQDPAARPVEVEHVAMIFHEAHYRAFFEARLEEGHRAFGEITPSYCILSAAELRHIRDCMPCPTRVAFVMRDPMARLWSQCRMESLKARNRGRTISAAELLRRAPEDDRYMRRSRYDLTVRAIDAAFEPEEVFYGFFETLFTEAEATRIQAFLGLAPCPFDLTRNPNEAVGLEARPDPTVWEGARRALRPVYDFARQRFGDAVPTAWSWP